MHEKQSGNGPSAGPDRQRRAWLLALGFTLVLTLAWPALGESGKSIPFKDFETATRQGMAQQRVTVVYFSATWCGWCRKMKGSSFTDTRVRELAGHFAWAEVDVDRQPDLSAAFGARGLPALALLNSRGELLTLHQGYLPATKLTELLETYRDQADAPGQVRSRLTEVTHLVRQLEEASSDDRASAAVFESVKVLAQADHNGRARARQAVEGMGRRGWPGLIQAMGHEQLAVRAAAYDLLLATVNLELSFDPFAPPEQRRKQLEAWRRWLVAQRAEAAAEVASEADEPNEPK